MDPQIWTTKEIIAAVIATGIVSALMREAVEWVKANARRDREFRYLCVAAAVALEAYSLDCKARAEAMEAEYETYKSVGSTTVPAPPILPADCDWRLVDVTLMSHLLSFANDVRKAQARASFEHHMEGNRWAEVTAVKALAERADAMAHQLRRNIGLA